MHADLVLHLTRCADDHKHRGNYGIKGAREMRVNDHLWYSTQALKLSVLLRVLPCREEKVHVFAVCKRFLFYCCVSSFNSVSKLVN